MWDSGKSTQCVHALPGRLHATWTYTTHLFLILDYISSAEYIAGSENVVDTVFRSLNESKASIVSFSSFPSSNETSSLTISIPSANAAILDAMDLAVT